MVPREPWAKTSNKGETLSIIEHCRDVAACFRLLVSGPVMRARFDAAFDMPLRDAHLDRLAVLAGLHDFGKASRGFQDKIYSSPIVGHAGHVSEALALLVGGPHAVRKALGVDLLGSWFKTVEDTIFATVCHHGAPVDDEAISQHLAIVPSLVAETILGHQPVEQIRRLREAMLGYYPAASTDPQATPLTFRAEAQHLFTGLLMTADWMASGFAFDPGTSEDRAQAVIDATAWRCWWNEGATPAHLLSGRDPRPSQNALMRLGLDEKLVVLEAPTGTGKTEAALIWASRLVEAGLVDGLYFAIPTRSAATELHERIGKLMSASHPKLRGKVVRAIPGMLNVDDARPDYPAETWAVAAPKKVFAAPVAVGTIDQALLSAIKTKHAWMRAAMLSRHLLVVDEVHASDSYMASLTKALIARHLRLGGYAFAMSATLGETALAELQNDRPRLSFEAAAAAPYPAIRTTTRAIPLGGAPQKATRIEFRAFEEVIPLVRQAVLRESRCVLWIRGTVRDAVRDYEELERLGVPTMLHHSRYAVDDRSWLDRELVSIFGLKGDRRPIVAVTTQTAEQSLDIDADLMVTDACPADVLLQRLGRLHRHRSGTTPTAIIIEPGDDLGVYLTADGVAFGSAQQGWPWVYPNLLSVRATIGWIRAHGSISVPVDSRRLVELATHADKLRADAEALGGAWERLWTKIYAKASKDKALADAGLINWNEPYRRAIVHDAIATRLGEGAVAVEVDGGLTSPFTGRSLKVVPVLRRWLPPGEFPTDFRGTAVGSKIYMLGVTFVYDRLGLRREGTRGSSLVGLPAP